jgi:hypothetical protein
MKQAPEFSSRLPEKHKILGEIQARADELYAGRLDKNGRPMTREQRFCKAIEADRVCKALYSASAAAPGYSVPPSASEPQADIAKDMAKRAGSANEQMFELARARQKVFPNESDAVAFTSVWTDEKNAGLKIEAQQENWSLVRADSPYTRNMNAPYQNPHVPQPSTPLAGSGSPTRVSVPRAGSGPRPSSKSFIA